MVPELSPINVYISYKVSITFNTHKDIEIDIDSFSSKKKEAVWF